mmetsp:Transcript_11201/g.11296  ORF Transcript_11201/g.11296 Transcript_11201/m.11296 type:complete len:149 (-) Transcript_11201:192-638(-)
MLGLSVSTFERNALGLLSWLSPSTALIPSSATSGEKQYRDPVKRAEADADKLTYKGNMRSRSAHTCVELTFQLRKSFASVKSPFLCLVGNDDVVVDNTAADELMEQSPSLDKTIKRYDALHGLMCEPPPLLGQIENDIIEWITSHTTK